MRIERTAHHHGHLFRCVVTDHEGGWGVRQEEDSRVVLDVVRHDWERVERDLMLFEIRQRHVEVLPATQPLPA